MAIEYVKLHDDKLRVLDIFLTVDGECNLWGQGQWSTFIRLAGCEGIYCRWCDTKYSWSTRGGTDWTIDAVISKVRYLKCNKITITGGEPLQQWNSGLRKLVSELSIAGYRQSIETSGCVLVPDELKQYTLNPPICLVIDYKLPGSGVESPPLIGNFQRLSARHFVKFVISDRADFDVAESVVYDLRKKHACLANMVFSPVTGKEGVAPKELFNWMKEREICDVGINLQMHKYIFPEDAREEEQ